MCIRDSCDTCRGRRFNTETLQIFYKNHTIHDVLEMTVKEAENFFSALPKIHTVLQTLLDVGLGYVKLGQPSTTLSGGERQRIVIAMAIAQETPLILLDEPTANLDIAHQSKVLGIVADTQRKRQGSVIIAMHDLSLAAQYCDRLIMLAEGVVHADGSPVDVLKPEIISRAYDTEVIVMRHPTTGSPVVVGVRK